MNNREQSKAVWSVIMVAVTLLYLIVFSSRLSADQGFYTVIDNQIYETPIPNDCQGCTVTFVKVHVQDKWIELQTDRISRRGFE